MTDNTLLAILLAVLIVSLIIFSDDIIKWFKEMFHIDITISKSERHTPSISNLPPPTHVLHTDGENKEGDDDVDKELSERNRRIAEALKPFDRVLVRDEENELWCARFFDYFDEKESKVYPFNCTDNDYYSECIPYEGNEHLHNTCDPAPLDPLHAIKINQ